MIGRAQAAGIAALLLLAVQAHGQGARLELRIVPQSGVPGILCVYDDPPTPLGSADPPLEAWASANIARRFELRYRLIDADPADGRVPHGLRSATFDITVADASAGLWARGLLSVREGETGTDTDEPAEQVDCSGLPPAPLLRKRGLHQPFRAALTGLDPSEDADNGSFRPTGIVAIHPLAAGPPGQVTGEWFGLYTFDFTPSAGLVGPLTIAAATNGEFQWYDSLGSIHPSILTSPASVTLRVPARPAACCSRGNCVVALTPSACFATGGFVATDNVCGPTPTSNCCFGDFNRDGTVGVQDVLDFVTAYLSGSRLADVNGSGTLTVQDVFDFLAAYFDGCG